MPKKGYKQSQEHKEKILKYLKPYKVGNSTRGFVKGSKHTEESKIRMRAGKRGIKVDKVISEEKRKVQGYKVWRSVLKRKFNMNVEDYLKILDKQDNRCAICGCYETKKKFAVDHNHKTGKIRGLLCFECNVGIGHLKENKQILENAIKYLEINS